MALDITRIAAQIGEMALKLKDGSQERKEHLQCAVDKLCDKNFNLTLLKHKIAASHPAWPVAGVFEALDKRYPAPPIPQEYAVVSTDGSNIDVDRNKPARCYLINVGAVRLQYGSNPSADLESLPSLHSSESELVVTNPDNKREQYPIDGALLDIQRSVEELAKLAQMADSLPTEIPGLALMDGSLMLFGLDAFPDYVQNQMLDEGFLKHLSRLQECSLRKNLALASYISLPGSSVVVNTLRLAICPQEIADCSKSCSGSDLACDAVSGLSDRLIFNAHLKTGERSALFIDTARVLRKYGSHTLYFYYLKIDEEIARVDVPEWVALRPEMLDLTHALILDQCRKGQGYPVALSEAHEKAVVSGADREEFWNLVEDALESQKLPTYTSLKSRSKRTRWI